MKIYLSKSNNAPEGLIESVRSKLITDGHHVLEYTGGKYNPRLVLEADQLIAITHKEGFEKEKYSLKDNEFVIGKGAGGEISQFMHQPTEGKSAFITTPDLKFHKVDEIKIDNPESWKHNHFRGHYED